MHPRSQYTLFKCVTLRKSLNTPPLPQDGKRKDQEDDDEGDKSGAQDFQDPKNVVNIIFGEDGGFPSKRTPKLTLRGILSVEPAIQKPLRYSEVPISFSSDDKWTSFSESRKFPLILDPVVAGSQLTRVLIDGGSGFSLLFASTLKKMGLDISKMFIPSRARFYGIVPGNVATLLGSVVLPVTFGTKDNYLTEYIKFEVADFESSYHAILGRPTLARFMVVPHYVYLLLKMLGKIGVLTFRDDLKKSYDCDKEAIEYAATSRVPKPCAEVFATAQKLTDTEMEISS
ncbi:uncharacterized protein C2845_PM16G03570 [Panicum miliaceum]|uniref:Retrotransposon protein, putative, Ty3-gypsy subclass n=1 Tax=Panicum miliaceum TaxID=4540 RepID=A0A3L6PWL5_PANMI|nr:uncharacterized protein C2845_PM16G03570 [Panicum miliaceum]